MKKLVITLSLFFLGALVIVASDFTEKHPEYVKKVEEIKAKNGAEIKGKLSDIIKEIGALKYSAYDEDEFMMFHTYLGELCTLNGDYQKSNDYYAKVVEKVPHATFYRIMVINMLHKGDTATAEKIFADFTKKAESIKDVEDRKRQVGHVKSAFDEVKAPTK